MSRETVAQLHLQANGRQRERGIQLGSLDNRCSSHQGHGERARSRPTSVFKQIFQPPRGSEGENEVRPSVRLREVRVIKVA